MNMREKLRDIIAASIFKSRMGLPSKMNHIHFELFSMGYYY